MKIETTTMIIIVSRKNEKRCHIPEEGCARWLTYYQWTSWVLLAMAFAYYLPR